MGRFTATICFKSDSYDHPKRALVEVTFKAIAKGYPTHVIAQPTFHVSFSADHFYSSPSDSIIIVHL